MLVQPAARLLLLLTPAHLIHRLPSPLLSTLAMSRLKEEKSWVEDSADSSDAASLALARQLQRQFDSEQRRPCPSSKPPPHDVVRLLDDEDDGSGGWSLSRSVPARERKRPLEETKQGDVRSVANHEMTRDEQLARQLQAEEEGRGKRQRTESSLSSSSSSSSSTQSLSAALTAVPRHSDTEQAYHDIAFYRNYVRGINNDFAIKLSDVVQGDITRAMLFNYCWDLPWILDSFPILQHVPVVDCIDGEKRTGQTGLARQAAELARPNIRCWHAPLPVPYSCHHTKMMLLFYDTGVRVVVMTANFLACDVYYKNQGIFVQDFPLKAEGAAAAGVGGADAGDDWLRGDFEKSLCEYLSQYRRMGLDVLELIQSFDYSAARAVLIPSAPGTWAAREMSRWGHMKVRTVLQRELTIDRDMERQPIIAQFSSIGSVQPKWLLELRRSLGGQQFPCPPDPPPIRMVWPTVTDVKESLEGWIAGGSLCCDSRNHKDFLRPFYHHWDGHLTGRHHAAPHIKSYSRSLKRNAAYVLLTSANMSAAAWGGLQKNDMQLAIRHYEMGVLILPSLVRRRRHHPHSAFSCTPDYPIYRHSDQRVAVEEGEENRKRKVQLWLPVMRDAKARQRDGVVEDAGVYRVVCPLPYSVESRPYDAAAEPWAWDVLYMEADWRGTQHITARRYTTPIAAALSLSHSRSPSCSLFLFLSKGNFVCPLPSLSL